MGQVRLNRVCKRFGKQLVVKDFTLDIQDGEFLVLLGPSGCGKTTTMRMIAGLEEISEGEIFIGERLVNNVEPKGRDISMVFQNYGLYPHLTVYENIRFPLKVRKVPRDQHHERVMRAIETVELTQLVDRRPAQLSGGQRQRVALGRAIVREPSVFLMDEPLSNLDAKLRISTRAQLKHLHHKLRATIIYVTHDQIEAMTLADRVVVMQEGVIQQIGSPSEIYGSPANTFVASFIGNPAMNLIEGAIKAGVFEAPGMRITGARADVERNIILGFRAEDASVVESGGDLVAPVYSTELLGEASMISFRLGTALVSVRAPKDYRVAIGDTLHIKVPLDACHLYSTTTGARIGPVQLSG